jgi:hypothetical protein
MQSLHADDEAIVELAHQQKELRLSSGILRDDLMHLS